MHSIAPPAPAAAVLDTNVVLDWLVFADPATAALARAHGAGAWRWHGTAAMIDELGHVLARGSLDRWRPDIEQVLTFARRECRLNDAPERGHLTCADPDDQKFIDLALALPARWLLTRDRSLLRLARRARDLGVVVLTPAAWTAGQGPPGA